MAMSALIQKFVTTVANLAGQLRGAPVLIVVRDPATRVVHFVGTPGALESMKPEITMKVGAGNDDGEAVTGWEG